MAEEAEKLKAVATAAACKTTLAMVAARATGATVCPSEVARALAAGDVGTAGTGWRDQMPVVHAAIDALVANGLVRLSWKGEALTTRSGPYRIGRR